MRDVEWRRPANWRVKSVEQRKAGEEMRGIWGPIGKNVGAILAPFDGCLREETKRENLTTWEFVEIAKYGGRLRYACAMTTKIGGPGGATNNCNHLTNFAGTPQIRSHLPAMPRFPHYKWGAPLNLAGETRHR